MHCRSFTILLFVALAPVAASAQSAAEPSVLDSLLNTPISAAAKYQQTIREVAGAVTIVTADDIRRYGYRTVAEMLEASRGFYLSNDRSTTSLGVRGFSRATDYNNRVIVLIDGQLANDGTRGAVALGYGLPVDVMTIERVEIVRGPGSALYGTGAMFAVINVVTKSGDAIRGLEVAGRGGRFGRLGGSALYGMRFGQNTEVTLSGSWDESDGRDLYYPEYDAPETNGGTAVGLDWERWRGASATIRRNAWTLSARRGSRDKGLPTGGYTTAFNDGQTLTREDQTWVQLGYQTRLDAARQLQARAYFQRNTYAADYAITSQFVWTDQGTHEVLGTEAMLLWDLGSADRLTVGTELRYNTRADWYAPRVGPVAMDAGRPYQVASAYAQNEYQFTTSLSALVGARFDYYSTTGGAFAPRGALIFSPTSGTTLKFLYGRAFRAPTLSESDTIESISVPSPDLHAETSETMELIWQQRVGRGLLATVSGFRWQVDDLIQLTGFTPGSPSLVANEGQASATGVELGLDARLGESLSGYANYTLQNAKDEDGVRLTNSPTHLAKAGLGIGLGMARPALELRYESGRSTLMGTRTEGYLLANVNLVVAPPAGSRLGLLDNTELSIRVTNLFGTTYATPGGVHLRQAAIQQDGRNLLAELRFRF
jgi:outer membrane receptor for ferrienterochelin and colicins